MYAMRMKGSDRSAAIARALGEPIRVVILHRLLEGPSAVGELVATTGASQPNVSNHLRILRENGLVRVERRGRHALYVVADATVSQLVESLVAIGGGPQRARRPDRDSMWARTCYDHLAGTLGVWLHDRLVALDALRSAQSDRGDIGLGPCAALLDSLGVDVAAGLKTRRRLAFGCLDWTERRHHLGGVLGAQICDRMQARGWIARVAGTRAMRLTPEGSEQLRMLFGDLPNDRRATGSTRR